MAFGCPLCGAAANRKGRPFESRHAVVKHIDAKRDEQHSGERGEDHRDAIQNGVEPPPPESQDAVEDAAGDMAGGPAGTPPVGSDASQDAPTGGDGDVTIEQAREVVEADPDLSVVNEDAANDLIGQNERLEAEVQALRESTVPAHEFEALEAEYVEQSERIEELEEIEAQVERCPDCDEPLGLTENLAGRVISCSECGCRSEVTAEP